MKQFLSGLAFLVSILALVVSGFTAYKVSTFEQSLESLKQSNQTQATPPAEPGSTPETLAPETAPSPTSDTGASNADIQAGQYVQPAWENKAQVELLSVKRITDPETGTRDVVNVQFRVRRLTTARDEDLYSLKLLTPNDTTARNPETSETHKVVSNKRATGSVALHQIPRGSSVDAYVWLKIPEGTQKIDIYFENTQRFENVPIANS
jgi:hypothetical protein